jgi:immune inhibitor A
MLRGDGLLIWHIDDSVATNSEEAHLKVALEQADGKKDLEHGSNRGDAGDPYPGSAGNKTFDKASTPNSKAYSSAETCVAVTNIGPSGPVMTAHLSVRCIVKKKEKPAIKDKEKKEILKDRKEKEFKEKEFKEKDTKDIRDKKDFKEYKERKEIDKTIKEIDKRKDAEKGMDRPGGGGFGLMYQEGDPSGLTDLEARLELIEARLASIEPFIDESLRPDLRQSALADEELGELDARMREGAAGAKRIFDGKAREY